MPVSRAPTLGGLHDRQEGQRHGLLPEPERTSSGYRAYTPDAVRVVASVKRAQQIGFTLDDIEDLLHLADGGPASCDEARTMARITDLQRRNSPREVRIKYEEI